MNQTVIERLGRARRRTDLVFGLLGLAACVFLALAASAVAGGWPASAGTDGWLALMSVAAFIFATTNIARGRQPDRYVGGPLDMRRRSSVLWLTIIATVLWSIGGAMLGWAAWSRLFGGPGGTVYGKALIVVGGLSVVIAPILLSALLLLHAMAVGLKAPADARVALRISAQGLFIPAEMRRPLAWSEVNRISAYTRTLGGAISFTTRAPAAVRHRSLWGVLSGPGVFFVYDMAADATLADILSAIDRVQPRLIASMAPPGTETVARRMRPWTLAGGVMLMAANLAVVGVEILHVQDQAPAFAAIAAAFVLTLAGLACMIRGYVIFFADRRRRAADLDRPEPAAA
jgi:hypothetical protein